MDAKFNHLTRILRQSDQIVLVAFSAGVDSTFLLKAAYLALGDGVIALTAFVCIRPARRARRGKMFRRQFGMPPYRSRFPRIDQSAYAQNPVNRCFFCKDELYRICREQADKLGIGDDR